MQRGAGHQAPRASLALRRTLFSSSVRLARPCVVTLSRIRSICPSRAGAAGQESVCGRGWRVPANPAMEPVSYGAVLDGELVFVPGEIPRQGVFAHWGRGTGSAKVELVFPGGTYGIRKRLMSADLIPLAEALVATAQRASADVAVHQVSYFRLMPTVLVASACALAVVRGGFLADRATGGDHHHRDPRGDRARVVSRTEGQGS